MDKVVHGASFWFPLKDGHEEKLKTLLDQMDREGPALNSLFPMANVASLHYATWVIVNEEITPSLRKLPVCVLLVTTYDGPLRNHIRELATVSPNGLHQILQCCRNYNESVPSIPATEKFLRRGRKKSFVYNAYQYTNRDEIAREGAMHDAIENFLDEEMKNPEFKSLTGQQIRMKIQEYVTKNPELNWALKPFKVGFYSWLKLNYPWLLLLTYFFLIIISSIAFIFVRVSTVKIIIGVAIVAVAIFIVALLLQQSAKKKSSSSQKLNFALPILMTIVLLMIVTSGFAAFSHLLFFKIVALAWLLPLTAIIVMLILLRINERRDEYVTPPDDEWIKQITDKEKYPVVNEMNVIGPLKRGLIRPLFFSVTLYLLRHIRVFGFIPTVHTGRWFHIDGGWRLVFVAYFDNTSEGYANDFVDSNKLLIRVNLMFGNAVGYPFTHWAIFKGGENRRGYMNAFRKQAKITNVWYYSQPSLSILNIRNNRGIREGLWGSMSDTKVREWLHRF